MRSLNRHGSVLTCGTCVFWFFDCLQLPCCSPCIDSSIPWRRCRKITHCLSRQQIGVSLLLSCHETILLNCVDLESERRHDIHALAGSMHCRLVNSTFHSSVWWNCSCRCSSCPSNAFVLIAVASHSMAAPDEPTSPHVKCSVFVSKKHFQFSIPSHLKFVTALPQAGSRKFMEKMLPWVGPLAWFPLSHEATLWFSQSRRVSILRAKLRSVPTCRRNTHQPRRCTSARLLTLMEMWRTKMLPDIKCPSLA